MSTSTLLQIKSTFQLDIHPSSSDQSTQKTTAVTAKWKRFTLDMIRRSISIHFVQMQESILLIIVKL